MRGSPRNFQPSLAHISNGALGYECAQDSVDIPSSPLYRLLRHPSTKTTSRTPSRGWGRPSLLCDQLIASSSNRPAFPAPKSTQFPLSPLPGEGRMPRRPPRPPQPTVYKHPRGSARLREHMLHVHTPRLPALPLSHWPAPQMTIIPHPLFAEVNNLLSDCWWVLHP